MKKLPHASRPPGSRKRKLHRMPPGDCLQFGWSGIIALLLPPPMAIRRRTAATPPSKIRVEVVETSVLMREALGYLSPNEVIRRGYARDRKDLAEKIKIGRIPPPYKKGDAAQSAADFAVDELIEYDIRWRAEQRRKRRDKEVTMTNMTRANAEAAKEGSQAD